jgi:diguanylate cyclase (GGDEF)-like protein
MPLLDKLTGLPTTTHFLTAVGLAATESHAAGEPLSVLVLDLDRFGAFNRHHGHEIGDKALLLVARLLRQGTGDTALAGRLGDDVFASLHPHTTIAQAAWLAQSMLTTMKLNLGGLETPLTTSIGVATGPSGAGWSGDEMLDLALSRCALAKQAGGNRVQAFGADEMLLPQRLGWPACH